MTLNGCTVSGNTARSGGGIYCSSAEATLIDTTISGNTAGGTSQHYGGGFYYSAAAGQSVFTNCIISGNHVAGPVARGGGIYCSATSAWMALTNCLVVGNTVSATYDSSYGGGLCLDYPSRSTVITNCTITGNAAAGSYGGYGGGLCCHDAEPAVTNCILWSDLPQEIASPGSIHASPTYCDIQGGWAYGSHNINADPLFVDAANGDHHLAANSPCIDAGNNAAIPEGITTDIDGDPRIIRGRPLHIVLPQPVPPPPVPPPTVDMGAYEFKLILAEPDAIPIGRQSRGPSGDMRQPLPPPITRPTRAAAHQSGAGSPP